jgi:hypothetical protein
MAGMGGKRSFTDLLNARVFHFGAGEHDGTDDERAKLNPEQHLQGIDGVFIYWMTERQADVCENK